MLVSIVQEDYLYRGSLFHQHLHTINSFAVHSYRYSGISMFNL